MKKPLIVIIGACLLLFSVLQMGLPSSSVAQTHGVSWLLQKVFVLTGASSGIDCGAKLLPLIFYEKASTVSLIVGFALVFGGILLERKKLKVGLFAAAVLPFGLWIFVHFFVDFGQIQRTLFNYNAAAEATLANIAEAQDRYKSEHETFLNDLNKLKSHMAGAHGMDACVKVLKIQASFNHWSAEARHVSSPDKIVWDSGTGSSLKKG